MQNFDPPKYILNKLNWEIPLLKYYLQIPSHSILTYFNMKNNFAYLLAFLFIIHVGDMAMAQAHKNCGMSSEDLQEVKRQMA